MRNCKTRGGMIHDAYTREYDTLVAERAKMAMLSTIIRAANKFGYEVCVDEPILLINPVNNSVVSKYKTLDKAYSWAKKWL